MPSVRISVLSDSPLTRGAVTALRWLGMPIRAFSPDAMSDAFDHVGLPSSAFTVATAALDEMSREVGIKPTLAAHG